MYDENGAPNTVYYYNGSTSATKYYYVLNLQGDVTEIRSTSNALVAQYNYDAFGNILSIKDANGNNITSSTHIANVNPLRYRGYFYDTETGFYYLNSRYYDPATRRFISADSIIDERAFDGLNLYAYCGNNPVMRVDPNGDAWWHWATAAAVVAVCAVAVVVTAGGAAPAITAVALVGSGTAAASTASTVASAAFIGSASYVGISAIGAAANSSSISDFCDQGNWGTVAGAAGSALVSGGSTYLSTQNNLSNKKTSSPFITRGSSGRVFSRNLKEQLAMEQVISNPLEGATALKFNMLDPRWRGSDGWVKMARNVNGVEIHFVYNTITREFDDFKFGG